MNSSSQKAVALIAQIDHGHFARLILTGAMPARHGEVCGASAKGLSTNRFRGQVHESIKDNVTGSF